MSEAERVFHQFASLCIDAGARREPIPAMVHEYGDWAIVAHVIHRSELHAPPPLKADFI